MSKVCYPQDLYIAESNGKQNCSVTIWPTDIVLKHQDHQVSSAEATTTARATILGGSTAYAVETPSRDRQHIKDILQLSPAEILISASFQPRFRLVKGTGVDPGSFNGRKVQMNICVTKLNQHSQALYLQSFQVLLVGYTDIRAGAARHGQMSFWTLTSLSNLGLLIFAADDAAGTKRAIDSRLWEDVVLEDSVVPDFATCNLKRRYELEILMGWQCQSDEHAGRVFFVQARTPVGISSGIWRSEVTTKPGIARAEETSAATVHLEHPQRLRNRESRAACTRLSLPPTYDEAIRAAVDNGLRSFEMRNAGGW